MSFSNQHDLVWAARLEAMLPQLPLEIWLVIAEHIPEDTLKALYGVNRFFFDQAMAMRYKVVQLHPSASVSEPAIGALNRVLSLQDPLLSQFVRRLEISNVPQEAYALRERETFLQHVGSKLLEVAGLVCSASFHVDHTRVHHVLGLVLESLPKVSELAIELWKILNNISGPLALSPAEVHILARNVYSSIGHNLHTLELTGMADSLVQFVEPLLETKAMETSTLRRLHLHIVHDPGSATRPWATTVAPFVNNFRPHLEELRIVSYPAISLSELFNALGHFPNLKIFHVYAPFNAALQHDSQGFIRFLHHHASTLQVLTLRLNPNRSALNMDTELSTWLNDVIADTTFCGLRELTVYPTKLPAGHVALTRCLQLSGHLLTDLAVRDSYYTHAKVDDLVSALPHGGAMLRRLKMNVLILDGPLFDLLSVKTAFIHELTLSSMAYGIGEDDSPLHFQDQLSDRYYEHWRILDMSMKQKGAELDKKTMTCLAACIPSLTARYRRDMAH